MHELTMGSLFTGVGGFDLGFRLSGFHTPWMSEWDKNCQHILRRHFPQSKLLGDVREISLKDISEVDVVTFGSPCQDLSHAGKRKGITGSRSSMFFEAIRILNEVKPKIIVWENVIGALTSNDGNDFKVVVESLARNNRKVAYRVLDSQHFGVPQRRKRIFVVSCAAGIDPKVVLDINDDKKHNSVEEIENNSIFSIQDVRPINKRQNGKGWSSGNVSYTLDTKSTQGFALKLEKKSIGFKPGQSSSARSDGSMAELCPTLETCGGGNNRPAIAIEEDYSYVVRRITPIEAERLQGFPDNWTCFGIDGNGARVDMSSTARFTQMGNAVTVNVANWIAENAKKELKYI